MTAPDRPSSRTPLIDGAVFAAYLAISLAITWPLALRLGSRVASDLGDPVGFIWVLWWNAQALPLTAAWLHAPIFYPSQGAIVFQDSLLGVWPFTTPVQWIGASPLVAYNLLVIGSFALSALTAYLLCLRLSRDRRAAFVGGLVFGFALYRMAQLPHINILLAFWVPLILLGLHAYLATGRWRWLALSSACWALQALTSGYFLAYSSVFVGLWALYFLRSRIRDWVRLVATFAVALAAIWPWLALYRTVHAAYAFQRNIGDAEFWAADVTGLVRAPDLLALWGPWLGGAAKEGQLFPGLTLAAVCVVFVAGSRYWRRPLWSRASAALVAMAACFGVLALMARATPTSFRLFGVPVSLGHPYKPLAWVWMSLLLALFVSPPVRRVLRDRSVAGFYAIASLLIWILSLGPTVRFMGERIWYKAPYAWLLIVPGSDAVRVPARFWLLALLALAVLAAFALAKLRRIAPRAAPTVTAVVCLGLLAEAWPARMPLPQPPERFAVLESRANPTPVLELPPGSYERDLAAMYRSIYHRAPVVNGYSAYTPASLASLFTGLKVGDPRALDPYAELTPLDIVVHSDTEQSETQAAVVEAAGARLVAATDHIRLYHLAQRQPTPEPPQSSAAVVQRVTDESGSDVTGRMTDNAPFSYVFTNALDVTLAGRCRVDEVELGALPGLVGITVRATQDGRPSQSLWSGSVAERSVRAALANPRLPRLRLRFPPLETDRILLELRAAARQETAVIQELRILGAGCGRATE